ncbi:glycosyltransferase [Microbacterium resistens]|uniref:glycosyltransferase n=1 Tax=Microbacterium resistens TaxID=156977 RepID=UPI00082CCFCC|nr:glycosyltransferase [Microbacterium resistens]
MHHAPQVSIVMPVFNDEETVAAALDSCLAQTGAYIEVICVDDASTDGTAAIIDRYVARDSRVRLLRQPDNRSALQARRAGILAARGEYVLFVDGDDELLPTAAEKSLASAQHDKADLVGFAVETVGPDGGVFVAYQKRLAPKHKRLTGDNVLAELFPIGKPAQGQLWRFLFRTQLLRDAYALLPEDLVLPRINDLPLLYLATALAAKYVAIPDRLYRYHFGRGRSGQVVDTMEQARFYADAIRSVESISPAVRSIAQTRGYPDDLLDNYESVRLSIIGYVSTYLLKHTREDLLTAVIEHLHACASATDLIVAAVRFYPEVLPALKSHSARTKREERTVGSILLTTRALTTGGVSGVLLSQADLLTRAGYNVVIVARRFGSDRAAVPEGIPFIEMSGRGLPERLVEWSEICRTNEVDLIIDHQILYSRDWPEYALVARAAGAATVGWIHNFAGRPLYDQNGLHELLKENAPLLDRLVTLSPLDVAFWKLRGVNHAVYLPNPPSPMLLDSTATEPKHLSDGPMELIWWGRLEERTKQVSQLIEVAVHLRKLAVDFRLTVIGPDWGEWTESRFNALAQARRVDKNVRAIGELRGQHLVDAIDRADAFVSTSIIEGYPLTILEAQARGLPVFMYELPWLAMLPGNEGIVSAPQGDAAALAARIAAVAESPSRYSALSRASVEAASRALSYDFGELYEQVITGEIPDEFSPEPSSEDSRRLLDLMIFFAEKGVAARETDTAALREKSTPSRDARLSGTRLDSSFAHRAWRVATPLGRVFLQLLPGARPLAHRMKHRLLLRTQR